MTKTKANKVKKPKIAKKPSVAILQALEDLRTVEKNPKYAIDMSDYHAPESDGNHKAVCEVCFAGAVIAAAGNDAGTYIEPSMFDADVQNKLYGLDNFRSGYVSDGLVNFGITKLPRLLQTKDEDGDDTGSRVYVNITPYEVDKAAFKKDLKELALELEALGL